MEMPWTAAEPPVMRTPPTALTVRGTRVTGRRRTFVNEVRTLRLIWAGLWDVRKRAVEVSVDLAAI
jgi:hypothetical protein